MQFAKTFIPNQYVFILAFTISQGKKVLYSRLQMIGLILGFPKKIIHTKFRNSDRPMMVNKLFIGSSLGILNKLMKTARGQIVLDKVKEIKKKPLKMSERGRRNIHQQTKILQEEVKFIERVKSFADMLPVVSEKKHPKGSKDK